MSKKIKSASMLLFLACMPHGIMYSAANFPSISAVEQVGVCKGIVKDASGETIIGASVVVKGTTSGNITGLDGDFEIPNVKKGAIIQVSFVGYQTKEVKWDGKPIIVVLEDDTQTLQEVVVTGYGGVQKAKTMTASASIVKMESLAKLPVASISEGLGGRVAGVITQQSSGAPGENVKIWIRGGSDILYVIDDVVMESGQGNEHGSFI